MRSDGAGIQERAEVHDHLLWGFPEDEDTQVVLRTLHSPVSGNLSPTGCAVFIHPGRT